MEKKLNILMATMQMGFGGAETHIYELARALTKNGHTITVASAGGEYAKMLVNISGVEIVSNTVSPYVDVPADQWYFKYINSAPFITGYIDGEILYFSPEEAAAREDVAVAMVKVLGIDVSKYNDADAYLRERFSDWEDISSHNRKSIAASVDRGLITGDQSGTFRPADPIIRSEVVAVLYRAFPDDKNVNANSL